MINRANSYVESGSDSERRGRGIASACDRRQCAARGNHQRRQKARRGRCGAHHYSGESKDRSGDQSHHDQAVFNVIAFLECVIPEVECLCYVAAKTNQQKQKRPELKKVSPHFPVLGPRLSFALKSAFQSLIQSGSVLFVFLLGDVALLAVNLELEEFFLKSFQQDRRTPGAG